MSHSSDFPSNAPCGATLLVALVEGYVGMTGGRRTEDTRQFVELFGQLIDDVDVFTRAVVAQKLAQHPDVPLSVLIRLASDEDFAVAEPVLADAVQLPGGLVDILSAGADVIIRRILARRKDLTEAQVSSLISDQDPEILTILGQRAVTVQPAQPPAPAETGHDLRFLTGDRSMRGLLLNEAIQLTGPAPAQISTERLTTLVRAATLRRLDLLAVTFAEMSGLRADLVEALFEDDGGEPLLVLCRHVGLGEEAMAQIMARAAPQVGEVVDQMFRLRALFRSLSADAASTMIAVMQEEWAPVPRHAPQVAPGRVVADAEPQQASRAQTTSHAIKA
jgi:uncharacterized protein (DUF2336 family)